jgi:hypothetical protein
MLGAVIFSKLAAIRGSVCCYRNRSQLVARCVSQLLICVCVQPAVINTSGMDFLSKILQRKPSKVSSLNVLWLISKGIKIDCGIKL